MELRQLRYFIKVVEHGGLGRAAAELGMVTSALSQQISRLESELATRLLTRTATGVVPTDAGIAFLRQAQPPLVAEVDGLTVLMDLVQHGFGGTIQPGAATARLGDQSFDIRLVRDDFLHRPNLLASLSDDELSPAALAVRVLLAQAAADLVTDGHWPGATLHKS